MEVKIDFGGTRYMQLPAEEHSTTGSKVGLCSGCVVASNTTLSCGDLNDAAQEAGHNRCTADDTIWKVDPGPMLQSDPQKIETAPNFGTISNIVAEPSPVGIKPGYLTPNNGGYTGDGKQTVHDTGLARSTDPQTSKDAAAKVGGGKLQDLVLQALEKNKEGHTGKELAYVTGRALNSITPRFAQLSRKGLIHDSGLRREKQVVWKIGNGVAA